MHKQRILLQGINIEHTYEEGLIKTPVLKGVNLSIESSKITAIVGKSGSGKSTLLHILGTLDTPTKGKIIFNNTDIVSLNSKQKAKFRNQYLGFVYQFHHLLADFTALENVMLPLLIDKVDRRLVRTRALCLLKRIGLADRMNKLPCELSGGERQRVAIARALVHSPELVLADEPTGNLDEANASIVFNLFKELAQDEGAAVVMVTHDQSLANRCDQILEIVDGVIVKDYSIDHEPKVDLKTKPYKEEEATKHIAEVVQDNEIHISNDQYGYGGLDQNGIPRQSRDISKAKIVSNNHRNQMDSNQYQDSIFTDTLLKDKNLKG